MERGPLDNSLKRVAQSVLRASLSTRLRAIPPDAILLCVDAIEYALVEAVAQPAPAPRVPSILPSGLLDGVEEEVVSEPVRIQGRMKA